MEIRRLKLENDGIEEEILEVSSYFEPILSIKEQDYAHPSFNNLFLVYDFDKETNSIVISRKRRNQSEQQVFLATSLFIDNNDSGDLEYEIDKEKFIGRGNLGIPYMIKNSIPYSNKLGLVTEPVVSLKRTVKIKPGQTINLDLIISVQDSKQAAIQNLQNYNTQVNVKRTFELAKARIDTESRYLRLKGKDISNFQKMLSYIIFKNPARIVNLKNALNIQYKQSNLWKYGISGDLPIILVKIKNANDTYVVKEVLKAYEFFTGKNIKCEIVIVDEEKHSYENYVREEIENSILSYHMGYLKNTRGGIFTLSSNEIDKKDIELLDFISSITINSAFGGIENNLKEIEDKYLEKFKDVSKEEAFPNIEEEDNDDLNIIQDTEKLKYFNDYGAFSNDGKEYLIALNKQKRLPAVWSNVLANHKFGTLVTDSMGGYSWYKNSRLNRVTAWENHSNYDIPSETIYIKNMENKKTWSLGLNPMPDEKNYNVIFGLGYCKYIHKSQGIEQELQVFVPKEDSLKVQILKLKNTTSSRKKLKIYYYAKPVIGEDEIKTNGNININLDLNNNLIIAKNLYNNETENSIVYASCSEKINSYTGDKDFFLGEGGLQNPDGISKLSLNNENALGRNSCIAYEVELELDSFSEKEISILLGAEDSIFNAKNMAYKYSKIVNCKEELSVIKNYWEDLLRKMPSKYTNGIC